MASTVITPIKIEKKRCPICRKRANHLDIICQCGGQFCMEHRMPEDHQCTFDYKKFQREKLEEKLYKEATAVVRNVKK